MFFKTFVIQSQTTQFSKPLPPPHTPIDVFLRSRLIRLLFGSHLPVKKTWLRACNRPFTYKSKSLLCLTLHKEVSVVFTIKIVYNKVTIATRKIK